HPAVLLRPAHVGVEYPANGRARPARPNRARPLRYRRAEAGASSALPGHDADARCAGEGAASGSGGADKCLLRPCAGGVCGAADWENVFQVHAAHLAGGIQGVLRDPRIHPLHDDDALPAPWDAVWWDRGLRDRMFQFSPVYVSAESMRWWLGRECFAKQKCILQTREEWREEDKQDLEADAAAKSSSPDVADPESGVEEVDRSGSNDHKAATAWYDHRAPPFALWVAGSDLLVDGKRLLRRFASGREPHVRVVHQKVIDSYEHLDVIWAVDVVEQVGREVKEVLWATCEGRETWRVPVGCEEVDVWDGKGVVGRWKEKGGEGSGSGESEVEEVARATVKPTGRLGGWFRG
ncbi:hypothetical protein V498_02978, partial [Pseudogymnoascus sp. VKM F-4517 (FW-2822)]